MRKAVVLPAAAVLLSGVVMTGTPAGAAGTGGAGHIAFEGTDGENLDIYSVNPDGTGLVRLTDDPAFDRRPAWSPDGSKIAFDRGSEDGLATDIFVMNADGSGVTQLTSDPAADFAAAWSPDGSQIVFASQRTGDGDIYVMDADGSSEAQLTAGFFPEIDPAWSPDGRQIAYSNYGTFWMMAADGSRQRLAAPNDYTYAYQFDWSPDGRHIAFYWRLGDYIWESIALVRANRPGIEYLTRGYGPVESPSFSPDGSEIVFSERGELYLMTSNGRHIEEVLEEEADNPDWGP